MSVQHYLICNAYNPYSIVHLHMFMEKMHGKRNERCWHDMGGPKQESSRQGCVEDICL